MSGNDERYNFDVCPKCRKTPKEFYIVNNNMGSCWYIPTSKRKKHTNGKTLILGIDMCVVEKEMFAVIIEVKCNLCDCYLGGDYRLFVNEFGKMVNIALRNRDYLTWGEWVCWTNVGK